MSDSTQVTVAGSIGIFAATVAALLWYGPQAAMVVLLVAVIGLVLDRISLFKRLDQVWEDTDKAIVQSALAVEAVEELRTWLAEFRAAFEGEDDDLAWGPETQPIPVPDNGPPTVEAAEVAAAQVRRLMDGDVEMVERTLLVNGEPRTFRLRAVKEDA